MLSAWMLGCLAVGVLMRFLGADFHTRGVHRPVSIGKHSSRTAVLLFQTWQCAWHGMVVFVWLFACLAEFAVRHVRATSAGARVGVAFSGPAARPSACCSKRVTAKCRSRAVVALSFATGMLAYCPRWLCRVREMSWHAVCVFVICRFYAWRANEDL